MKRQLTKLMAVGTMAAGMIFAQAQTNPQAPVAQPNQAKTAHGGSAPRNHPMEARRRMMAALNLSPEQKAKAKAIFEQARSGAKPAREELRQNREALAAAVKANNPAQIEKLSAERGRLTAKLTTARGEAMAKFYQELTPAQKAKAERMQARISARMHERWAHRGQRTNG